MHSRSPCRLLTGSLILALIGLPFGATAALGTPRTNGLALTIAARSSPHFADITADLAPNKIIESPRDLGADTSNRAGEQVDPPGAMRSTNRRLP